MIDLVGVNLLTTDYKLIEPFNGSDPSNLLEILCSGVNDNGNTNTNPTSTNIVSGNVKKLGLPFKVRVVAMSVELNPKTLGSTFSDAVTGDYSIDVYPHSGLVLLYAVQDYGLKFNPLSSVTAGQIIHPTTPNKNVYECNNDGVLGSDEPNWPDSGLITSNQVTLTARPLYRPLANGFVYPVITQL